MPVSLILIRHGETAWNAIRKIQGQLDISLNDTGQQQANSLVNALRDDKIDAAYCSDAKRTRETIAPWTAANSAAVTYRENLRERHFGAFQGMTYDEMRREHSDKSSLFLNRDLHYDLDGGESLDGFNRRATEAFADIVDAHPDQTVLVVTHGGVLDCVYRAAQGMALDVARDFDINNAAINRFHYDNGKFRVQSWADVSHLSRDAGEALDEL